MREEEENVGVKDGLEQVRADQSNTKLHESKTPLLHHSQQFRSTSSTHIIYLNNTTTSYCRHRPVHSRLATSHRERVQLQDESRKGSQSEQGSSSVSPICSWGLSCFGP